LAKGKGEGSFKKAGPESIWCRGQLRQENQKFWEVDRLAKAKKPNDKGIILHDAGKRGH